MEEASPLDRLKACYFEIDLADLEWETHHTVAALLAEQVAAEFLRLGNTEKYHEWGRTKERHWQNVRDR